jgi:hypothetical protein
MKMERAAAPSIAMMKVRKLSESNKDAHGNGITEGAG